jgi:hypothetical protein
VTHVPRGHATATHHPCHSPCATATARTPNRPVAPLFELDRPDRYQPHRCGPGAWLPSDSFHTYDGPTVFGTDTDWTNETPASQNQPVDAVTSPPLLNSDAEITQLPPGLLDSPPHPVHEPADTDAAITAIQRLCSDILTPPPAAVLLGGDPLSPVFFIIAIDPLQ